MEVSNSGLSEVPVHISIQQLLSRFCGYKILFKCTVRVSILRRVDREMGNWGGGKASKVGSCSVDIMSEQQLCRLAVPDQTPPVLPKIVHFLTFPHRLCCSNLLLCSLALCLVCCCTSGTSPLSISILLLVLWFGKKTYI